MLFFSGGTALRGLSGALVRRTWRSRHIVTPFDSGGSSAKLRRAFHMPAVGDLRNRLMALSDTSAPGSRAVYDLFAFRFPEKAGPVALTKLLEVMTSGQARQIRHLPEPARSTIREHLGHFLRAMPEGFDLRGAAVGNLVLTGGFLHEGRRMEPVLDVFSRLVRARGVARPVVEEPLHLAAHLTDGRMVAGQHRLTGKEGPAPTSPIERLFLTKSLDEPEEYRPVIEDGVAGLIRSAELICYPVGSFYTSLIANLLPDGVADAITEADAPKVYVPNPSHDPEEIGMDLVDKVATLQRYLRAGVSRAGDDDRLLGIVLLDATGSGIGTDTLRALRDLGVDVLDARLISETSAPYLDDRLLAEAILSLV